MTTTTSTTATIIIIIDQLIIYDHLTFVRVSIIINYILKFFEENINW